VPPEGLKLVMGWEEIRALKGDSVAVATRANCKRVTWVRVWARGNVSNPAVTEIRVQQSRTINSVRLVPLFRVHMAVPGKRFYVCTTDSVCISNSCSEHDSPIASVDAINTPVNTSQSQCIVIFG